MKRNRFRRVTRRVIERKRAPDDSNYDNSDDSKRRGTRHVIERKRPPDDLVFDISDDDSKSAHDDDRESSSVWTSTTNGAAALKSTGSYLLDFYSRSAACRNDPKMAVKLCKDSLQEDELHTLRCVFYLRDARGGQGERRVFRAIIHMLACERTDRMREVMKWIPHFGRWDDMYALVGTPLEQDAFAMMKTQFDADMDKIQEDQSVSLLAKWLKSENASSKTTKKMAVLTYKAFGLSAKEYRQALARLRKKIDLVETKLTEERYADMEYAKVPSLAMKKYMKAFKRSDGDHLHEYLEEVQKGKAKIHAKTLYPYDLVRPYLNGTIGRRRLQGDDDGPESVDEGYEVLWQNLPNYLNGEYNCMVVVDTSGSMYGGKTIRPIDVAVSLGLYIAERNQGVFHNAFITFSSKPKLEYVRGDTLREKVENLAQAHWDGSTNLLGVFELICNVVKEQGVPPEQIPKKLFIVSDMQFDQAVHLPRVRHGQPLETTFETIESMFKDAGIPRPELVFWNVQAHSNSPVCSDQKGTTLVSGASPSILKAVLSGEGYNPHELMMEVLDSRSLIS